MRKWSLLSMMLIIVMIALLASGPGMASTKDTSHDFGCEGCHAVHDAQGVKLWKSKVETKTPKGTPLVGTAALCFTCHGEGNASFFEKGHSHPINVPPSDKVTVPQDLPLHDLPGVGKVIACTTCHDPHSSNKKFLRKDNKDGAFCLACHPQK